MTRVTRRVSLIALSLLVATPCLAQSPSRFRPTGDMTTPRSFHTATRRAPISQAAMFARGGGQSLIADVPELAFVRDGQIFRVRLDGSEPVQLTSDGVNSEPAWSPDGRRIAFVHQSSPDQYASDLYVMNADGSNVVRRTNRGVNSSPAWSPDGTRIAFSSLRDGQFGIYVMRVDEDWWNPAHLGFDVGWNGQPAWSPDGGRIAFVSDWRAYDILYDLYVMNADGSDVRLLLGGPFFWQGLTYYFQPAWSPDGGTIALTVCPYAWDNCFPDSTVALMNADGSGLRSIANAGGYARPSWSPDGSRIAFGSSECRGCPSSIQYVTRDGTESGVLVRDAHSPTWRPSPPTRVLVTANGIHGSVTLSGGQSLTVAISFDAGSAQVLNPAEVYLGVANDSGTVLWMDPTTYALVPTMTAVYSGSLAPFGPTTTVHYQDVSALTPGRYWWFIVVDADSNGVPNSTYFDYTQTVIQ